MAHENNTTIPIHAIWSARNLVYRYARETPCFLFGHLYLKLENLQPMGAFKIRGATHYILKNKNLLTSGVVTASSGNHGYAVAYVCQKENLPCTVVVPETIPEVKKRAIISCGAQLIYAGKTADERHKVAMDLVREKGFHFIPSYDHPDIMTGQGTLGLEILQQVPDVRVVYVPVSGGGLASGVVSAIKTLAPQVQVVGVEPARIPRYARSREMGQPVAVSSIDTIADGLRVQKPGVHTWPVLQKWMDDFISVEDDEIIEAMAWCMIHARQVVEPSGAASVAGALKDARAYPAVAVVSGGNVDPERYVHYLKTTTF